MRRNENASRRWSRPAERLTETIAAEQLIPQLHSIMAFGGIQASRRKPWRDRLRIYEDAKREFREMESRRQEPCEYDYFNQALREALLV